MPNVYLCSSGVNWSTSVWSDSPGGSSLGRAPVDGETVFLCSYWVNLDCDTANLAGLYAGQAADATGSGTIFVYADNKTLRCSGTIQAGTSYIVYLISNYTFTLICANMYAGTGNSALYTAAGTQTINFAGNICAGQSAVGYIYGFNFGGSGITLNMTGDVHGGTVNNNYGIWMGCGGTLNITGNVYGGTQSYAKGVFGKGTVTITGNVYGGSASNADGIGTNAGASITVSGNVTGGNNGAHGIRISNSNSNVTVGELITGGANSSSYGVTVASGAVTGCTINANGGVYGAAGCGIVAPAGTANVIRSSSELIAVAGGSANSAYGVSISGTTILTITGSVTGGTVDASACGIYAAGSGSVTITGDVTASLIASAIWNNSSSTITVTGNISSGSGAASGITNNGSGKIVVIGNVTGGSGANATGISNWSTGMLLITGNVTGGTVDNTAYAVRNNYTGRIYYGGDKTNNTANAFSSETYVLQAVIAKTAGNWSTGSNWYGNAAPTAEQNTYLNNLVMVMDIATITVRDVYAIGAMSSQLIIDASAGVKILNAGIISGSGSTGLIRVNNSGNKVTVNCTSIVAGTSTCAVYIAAGAIVELNVSDSIYGGIGLNTYGVYAVGAGATLTINGTLMAGVGVTHTEAVYLAAANLIVTITGTMWAAQSGSGMYGMALYANTSASGLILTIVGNLYGGNSNGDQCFVMRLDGTGTVVTQSGGTLIAGNGIYNSGCIYLVGVNSYADVSGDLYAAAANRSNWVLGAAASGAYFIVRGSVYNTTANNALAGPIKWAPAAGKTIHYQNLAGDDVTIAQQNAFRRLSVCA